MSQREKEANEVREIERFTNKMSDKNSESFEEWFNANSMCPDDHEAHYTKGNTELAWNARGEIEQKKIDELNKKLQAAEEENRELREAVEFAIEYCASIGEKGRLRLKLEQVLEKVRKETE